MKQLRKFLMLPALLVGILLLTGCERPPIEAVQHGFRGTAMDLIYNPRILAEQAEKNTIPASAGLASAEGPKAGAIYQNVKVLNNLSVGQFTSFMVAMTSWVAPEQGCAYCHNVNNFADDSLYTKSVARNMILMTQRVNTQWQDHVAQTGVTCYTCHRGNNIPQNVWFKDPPEKVGNGMLGNKNGQNTPVTGSGYSSLPKNTYAAYLLNDEKIEVNGETALPTGKKSDRASINATEGTYGLMIHFSNSLGVNCTYCHNTRAIASWEESPPQRAKAWYAIQMAQDLNNNYMEPIQGLFPPHRLGPTGDVAKANCATCHQGAYKPLYGVSMLADYPYLTGPAMTTQKPPKYPYLDGPAMKKQKVTDAAPPTKSVAMK
jgi:photosynthetic reaction center cytochrome c subunit